MKEITFKFVEFIPDKIEEGVLQGVGKIGKLKKEEKRIQKTKKSTLRKKRKLIERKTHYILFGLMAPRNNGVPCNIRFIVCSSSPTKP
jgi:hypothetical protein